MLDFDYLLERVGTFGKYQIIVFISLCYFGIPSGLNALASVFLSYTPEYRCLMYPFDNSSLYPNLTNEELFNLTTPLDDKNNPIDACQRYGYDLTECSGPNDFSCVNKSEPLVSCDEYYYNDSPFEKTTVTEFDLVCDRRISHSLSSSAYMIGMFVGSLLFGNIADRFGRKFTIILTCYGMLFSMLGVAFCNMIELFSFTRFLVATFAMGCNVAIFCYIMEMVGTKWRTLVGISYQMAFAIGYMLWSGIAYLYRDWHQMELGAVVMSAPLAIIVLIVPESGRWLFTAGKEKKGKKVVSIMARLNKVKLDENIWSEAEKSAQERENDETDDTSYSTIDLFKHSKLRIVTLKVGFNWAVNSMVYYGISLNAGSLAGDIFLNNIYAGVLEIASYTVCAATMDFVGRRLLLTITLTGAGVALLVSTIVNAFADGDESLILVGVVFAFIGKALVSGSFAVIYNFTGELFPTVVRSNGIGFGSMSARIGSVLSPFIIGLQDYVSWLPNTIFGAVAVIGGLLSLTFRDTTGKPMMETIEEAELFYAGKDISRREKMTEGYDNKAAIVVDEDERKTSTQL
uniref:organic cation transporter protein-like n=1 Tax=Styela clava TaxID=7725 RepID=UPI00193A236C|nr:organic cation transporter protein-like [Styela clava]